MYYVDAINFHEGSGLFIATLFDPFNDAYGPPGLYLSTSPDLIKGTTPTLVVTVAQLLAKEPKGNWSYAYFSLLDPNSPDPNYWTVTDDPYLYYVRLDNDHPPYVRVLFRQRIRLTEDMKITLARVIRRSGSEARGAAYPLVDRCPMRTLDRRRFL